jgi:hypothetical protein
MVGDKSSCTVLDGLEIATSTPWAWVLLLIDGCCCLRAIKVIKAAFGSYA